MSNNERDDRTPELIAATELAKSELVPNKLSDADWERMDEALFAKLDAQQVEDTARAARTSRNSRFFVVGGALAVAASALFFLKGSATDHKVPEQAAVMAAAEVSSVLSRVQGELLISGQNAALGASLKPGDSFELRGRRAVFDSPQTAKFMFDGQGTRGRVLKEGASIALSLEDGAVEAEVIPGSDAGGSKERFAVELGRARVSVRGTHLRVARSGRKVTVDLTRGSIAVGREVVSAPAHVELDAEDANAIVIDRFNVRPAESFDEVVAAVIPAAPAAGSAKEQPRGPGPMPAAPSFPAPRLVPTAVAVPVDPKVRLEAAVRQCMLSHGFTDSSPSAHLSLSTTLQMQVSDDGKVQSARFSPPLPPKAQECASVAVYGTHFASGGPVILSVQATQ